MNGQPLASGRWLRAAWRRQADGPDGGEYVLDLSAQDITAPLIAPSFPLGSTIEQVTALGHTRGGLPREPWPAGLVRWQAEGGALVLERLDAIYGPLAIDASGTVTVDETGQPVAVINTNISGMGEAVDALSDQGWMTHQQALYARMVIKSMARQPTGGGPPVVSAPLVVEHQKVYVGPFQIGKIPPVHWHALDVGPHKSLGAG